MGVRPLGACPPLPLAALRGLTRAGVRRAMFSRCFRFRGAKSTWRRANRSGGACSGTTVSSSWCTDSRGCEGADLGPSSGVVAPSPACKRALETVVNELKARGHDVVTMCAASSSLPYPHLILCYAHPETLPARSKAF